MARGIGGAREAAELDTGYCHLSMPKVDLVLSLDRRPQPALVPFWMHRSLPSFRKKQRGEEASQQQVGAALGPKSPAAQQPGVRNTFICVKVYPGEGHLHRPPTNPSVWKIPYTTPPIYCGPFLLPRQARSLDSSWACCNAVEMMKTF